jgi:bacterioferritin-associated ferredoxin
MYACICTAVTTAQVQACISDGAHTVEEIGDHCGAGTGCGTCVERLDHILARELMPAGGTPAASR